MYQYCGNPGRDFMSGRAQWRDGKPVIPTESLTSGSEIADWLSVGPFPIEEARRFLRDQGIGRLDTVDADYLNGERQVRPIEGMQHANRHLASGSCAWQRLPAEALGALGSVYPQFEFSVAYAATYLLAETDCVVAFRIGGTGGLNRSPRLSTVQVMLDGVVIGRGDSVCFAQVSAGEHCLLAKAAGGAHRGDVAWTLQVEAQKLPAVDGVALGLARLNGFWQGDEQNPRAEVEVVVANAGAEAADVELTASLRDGEAGPAKTTRVEAGACRTVRLSTPVGSLAAGDDAVVIVTGAGLNAEASCVIPVKPDYGVLHIMEGFHCDPVWVSDQHHYNLECLENVRQLLDGCVADAGYRGFVHEIDYLKSFVDEYPDYRTLIFESIRNGQMNVGSSYSEPNENNCSGEAIIRNILYGYGYHRKFLGGDPGIYHAWDVFGHTPQLSQILKKSGLSGALWSKDVVGVPPMALHMSPDGTALPHIRTPYGWQTMNIDHLRASLAPVLAEKCSYGINRHLVVDCGDFTCPTGWMVGHTDEMAESYPKAVMTGPEAFLKGVLEEDGAKLPLTSRNITQYHVGTFLSRSELKVANRLGENALASAEKWATVAALMGAQYPDLPIDKAWRQLLFGQHHDALSGTPCDVSYLDLMVGYREALDLATDVVRQATKLIADAVKRPADGTPLVVFNPLNWSRTGLVTACLPEGVANATVTTADGEEVASTATDGSVTFCASDVPSVGYATFVLRPKSDAPAAPKAVAEPILENEFWQITLDPARGGGIVSLIDKATGEELVDVSAGPTNDLVALRELNLRHEPSWEFWTTGDRHHASQYKAKVTVEQTALGQKAVITGELNTVCTYVRTLEVRNGDPVIRASVKLENYAGEDDLFVVTVNPALEGSLPTFEDKFSSLATLRGQRKFDYRTWRMDRFSHCGINPVYNWVDAGWSARIDAGSASSLNLGAMGLITSHDASVRDRLADLLKSFVQAGVTCTPLYDDDDVDRWADLRERYPHGQWQDNVVGRREDLPFTAQWMAVSVDGDNAYVEGLLAGVPEARKALDAQQAGAGWGMVIAEDSDVPEPWGTVPVVILSAKSMEALRGAVSWIGGQLAEDGRIRIPAEADLRKEPGKVSERGLAILSTGTGAAAMEPDGTLTLLLTHTANWSDTHLGRKLIPEHRSMVYHYGFLPHEGSWRDSDLVRAGYEINVPMDAVLPEGAGGALPESQSFLSVDDEGVVVTAMKPAGNPVASFESAASNPKQGVVVRAYNADGRGSHAALKLAATIASAESVNLMEEAQGDVPVENGAAPMEHRPVRRGDAEARTGRHGRIRTAGSSGRERARVTRSGAATGSTTSARTRWDTFPVGIYLEGEPAVGERGRQLPDGASHPCRRQQQPDGCVRERSRADQRARLVDGDAVRDPVRPRSEGALGQGRRRPPWAARLTSDWFVRRWNSAGRSTSTCSKRAARQTSSSREVAAVA